MKFLSPAVLGLSHVSNEYATGSNVDVVGALEDLLRPVCVVECAGAGSQISILVEHIHVRLDDHLLNILSIRCAHIDLKSETPTACL
jgi:hypothetical protein